MWWFRFLHINWRIDSFFYYEVRQLQYFFNLLVTVDGFWHPLLSQESDVVLLGMQTESETMKYSVANSQLWLYFNGVTPINCKLQNGVTLFLIYVWYRLVKTDCAFSSCSYWDMAYDGDVMDNRVGLNLLYAQVRAFTTRGKPNTVVYFQLNSSRDVEPSRKSNLREILFVYISHLLCSFELACCLHHIKKAKSGTASSFGIHTFFWSVPWAPPLSESSVSLFWLCNTLTPVPLCSSVILLVADSLCGDNCDLLYEAFLRLQVWLKPGTAEGCSTGKRKKSKTNKQGLQACAFVHISV